MKIVKIVQDYLPHIRIPKQRGRPQFYSATVMVCCLLVMVAKRLTVRGLYDFLTREEEESLRVKNSIPFPNGKIPNRRTFDRRFKTSIKVLQLFMLSAVSYLVKHFHLGIARLSLDNRMFQAVGGIWHEKDRKKGILPKGVRNIDQTAGWGVSAYRGWIFGHALEVFVSTGKLIIPILAFARSLLQRGNQAIKETISLLPKTKRGIVAADSEYEDQKLAFYTSLTGRILHTPSKRYPKKIPKSKTYQKRKTTIEPYFERFLQAFVLRGKLDRKGPDAWPYLIACCFLYQLMVIYNLLSKASNPLEITHLIRIL